MRPCKPSDSPGRPTGHRARPIALAALVALASPSALAEPSRRDPDTGAATWEVQTQGVTLSLTQLLPDQIRAFYSARGFDAAAAEVFAQACVFMTVLRNDAAAGELSFRLADWQVRQGGEARGLPSLAGWLERWQGLGVSGPARIAFRWAQFPPEQSYAPGEWNQGMLATGLPPGSRFNLSARWTAAGQTFEGRLQDVQCSE